MSGDASAAIIRTVEVPTEDGRYAAIDFHRRRSGYWSVDISDELIAQAPESLTACLVLAFRQLAAQNGSQDTPS